MQTEWNFVVETDLNQLRHMYKLNIITGSCWTDVSVTIIKNVSFEHFLTYGGKQKSMVDSYWCSIWTLWNSHTTVENFIVSFLFEY